MSDAQIQDTERQKQRPYRNAYRSMMDAPDVQTDPNDPANADTQQVQDNTAEPNAEEVTFKKRYGDLRRWADKTVGDLKAQITAMQQSTAQISGYKPPKTEAEVNAWLKEFPDVGNIVKTIADKSAIDRSAAAEAKSATLERKVAELAQERALLKIEKTHPDFNELRAQDGFHAWAAEQPKQIQAWLYENVDDADLVIKAVNLYKLEKGITEPAQKKPKEDKKASAQAVGVRQAAADPLTVSGKRIWKASEIAKMTPRMYEKYEDEVDLARAEGRFDFNS